MAREAKTKEDKARKNKITTVKGFRAVRAVRTR